MILIAAGQLFAAGQIVLEERFASTRNYDPVQVTGVEGVVGLAIYVILLAIFNHAPCSVLKDDKGNILFCPFGLIENTVFAFQQIDSSQLLVALVATCSVIIVFEDTSGMCIVKAGSAMQRAISKSLRSLCVWAVSMGIGWEQFMWSQVS